MSAQRIPVLMYHRIGEQSTRWDRHYSVTPRRFAEQMHALAANGYTACSLQNFLDWMDGAARLPENTFLITFDDGFCGVYDHARPVLRALGWPFTVFMVSGGLGQAAGWAHPADAADRSRQLMNAAEVGALLDAGASIQSHTRSHCDLTSLDTALLDDELQRSRDELQQLTGRPVDTLAYPFGRHDERVIERAKLAGYRTAFSVQPGFNRPELDRLALRRLDVFGADSAAALRRKLQFGSNDGSFTQELRYAVRRVMARLHAA